MATDTDGCKNKGWTIVSKKVVIIGAGIGGIATASLLAKAGYNVSVYEKNDGAGGRAGLLERDGFRFDTGPSWYLMPEVFEHYFSLLGKDVDRELDLIRLSPAYRVFFESQPPVTITSDLATDAQTFESIEPGAGNQLQRYVSDGDIIYRLSLKYFLYSNFSDLRDLMKFDIIKKALPLLRRALQPIDRYVASFVHDKRLQQILEYPMVFLGTSPFSAPAIYSLMSALDFKEGVFYPQGGMYTIIERMMSISRELGVDYHFDAAVKKILTVNGTASGIELDDGTVIAADIVISNADLHFTETKLLQPTDQSYPTKYWSKQQSGPSALLMYLGIRGELPSFNHHNLLFVDSWEQNFRDIYIDKTNPHPASIYICNPSKTDPSVAPTGTENIFVLVPLPPDADVPPEAIDDLADQYIKQISAMTNVPDFADRIISRQLFGPDDFRTKFHAWQATALGPSHVLSQSALFRTPNKSKKVKNLYYVGAATTPGIGLPMCLIGAELIYKRLAGDTRGGAIERIEQIGDRS
ncbi:MAG: phytoene desaturase [Chloroflexi bacterium]|nr:MAG: phytoene desaturase [Chloroflexota bacterium]